LAAAYPVAAQQLIEGGEDMEEVETALTRRLASRGTLPDQADLRHFRAVARGPLVATIA